MNPLLAHDNLIYNNGMYLFEELAIAARIQNM